MRVVGTDGCKAGWLWIALEEGRIESGISPSFDDLWQQEHAAHLILIDIPIGLRGAGSRERLCDVEARKRLGPKRGPSVFPAPCRDALLGHDYRHASQLNRGLSGRGLSKQSWAIARKIKEVDDLLRACDEARSKVREVHPEVLFWSLNSRQPMINRKTRSSGFEERLGVLERFVPNARSLVIQTRQRFGSKAVAKDDILDALAAAVTAQQGNGVWSQLPALPERDEYGLAMEMLYLDNGLA